MELTRISGALCRSVQNFLNPEKLSIMRLMYSGNIINRRRGLKRGVEKWRMNEFKELKWGIVKSGNKRE